MMIMPRIRGIPPIQVAERERLKYEGPHTLGHRYPEPMNGSPTDWTIEPIPAASIEKAINEVANSAFPLIWLEKMIGRQRDTIINKTC